MRKNIKNYTTGISVEKTIFEIQQLLVSKGAKKIMTEYANNVPTGLMFLLETKQGEIPFRLPARIEGVERVFLANKKPKYSWRSPEPLSQKEKDQAMRTGWRNIKDWIDAQLALIETEMVKMEEIFFPYAVSENETMYERFENKTLQITSGD